MSNYIVENSPLTKTKILCEDEVAEILLKRIIRSTDMNSQLVYSHVVNTDNPGISWKLLSSLCRSFPTVLDETRAIVVFDADMAGKNIRTGNYEHVLFLPSLFNLPFEKEIVKYILSLNGSDKFFKQFKLPKEMFKQRIAEYEINLSTENYSNDDVTPFKKWYTAHKSEVNKYLTYYVNNNRDIFDPFKEQLIEHINSIRIKNGFVPIQN
ncbi:hypothetical protein A5868_001440 [Enterococcus sp. 12F9_DIV0723]|nr:hypothetical protein A5868_001440 [Enterococcus sp. 12F9_DIV0723]